MTECTFAPEREDIRGRKVVHVQMVASGEGSRTNHIQKECISISIEAQVMMVLMNIVASYVTFSTHCSEKNPFTAHQLFGDVALLRLLLAKLFGCCFKPAGISAGDFISF